MEIKFSSIILLWVILTSTVQAQVRVEMTTKSGESINWKKPGEWAFSATEDDQGQILTYNLTLELPSGLIAQKAKLKSGLAKVDSGGKRILLTLPGLENQLGVIFADGRKQFYRLKVLLNETVAVEKGCKKHQLKLFVPEQKANFFYGLACREKGNDVFVAISFPHLTDWISSNIFESAGKGERWKAYQFKADDLASRSGVLGAFQVRYKNLNLDIKLKSINKPGLKKPKEFTNLFVSGVVGQFNMKTVGGEPSAVQPGLRLEATTKPLLSRFGILADLITAFPLGGEEKAQSFLEFTGAMAWIPRDRKGFHLLPFIGYDSLSQDQSDLNISFKHGNLAIGTKAVNPLGNESELSIGLWGSGITGGSSSNYVLDVKYVWPKLSKGTWFVSGTYRMQKAEGKTALDEGDFSQIMLAVGQKF